MNGLIEKVGPSVYMLNLAWPIVPNSGTGHQLKGYKGIPDEKDLQHRPMDCRNESVQDGIYRLRIFFYYKSPKSYIEFPVTLGFVSYGPDLDSSEMPVTNQQTVVCNFLVKE